MIEKNVKYNDRDIAEYAGLFNSLCKENNITSFWWDTNLLIDKNQLATFPLIINSIMNCYDSQSYSKKTAGFVEESAECAVKNMKTGWNLGNTFDACKYSCKWNKDLQCWEETVNKTGLETENCWFQPTTTREMIHYVKSLGFNAVRLPVTWAGHFDENNKIDEKWLERVKTVAGWILEEDMYCIINTHHDGGGNGWVRACESSYNKFKDRYVKIYSQICACFTDFDERLLFGGTNEMLDENSSWDTPTDTATYWIEKWNQLFVDTVRKSGGNNEKRNLVVMAGAGKGSVEALKKFNLPEDSAKNHLIFEFHNYDPQCFCWPQNPDGSNKNETPFWKEDEFAPVVKRAFSSVLDKEAAGRYNVPLICGEYAAWPKKL